MRTEWLAFGVPVRDGARNASLALGRGGCGSKRFAEEWQIVAGDNLCDPLFRSWHGADLLSLHRNGGRVRRVCGVGILSARKRKGWGGEASGQVDGAICGSLSANSQQPIF